LGKPSSVPLVITTVNREGAVTQEIFAGRSVEGLAEAIADDKGSIHVVYGERTTAAEGVLKYRRGKYQGD
jgi:hypothetical protein